MSSGMRAGQVGLRQDVLHYQNEEEQARCFIRLAMVAFSFIGSYWTARSFGFSRPISLVLSTGVAVICLRILPGLSCRKKSLPADKSKEKEEIPLAASPDPNDWKTQIDILPGEKPYAALERGTELINEDQYLKNAPFPDYLEGIYPGKKTVIQVDMQEKVIPIHANKVGDGVLENPMVASAYPYYPKSFWNYVFQYPSTIFDLALKRPTDGWQSPYLGLESAGDVLEFSIGRAPKNYKVSLIDTNGSLYTYEIENTVSGEKEQIKRYHYKDWPDMGVVAVERLEFLVQKVQELCKEEKTMPWVHCAGGIGRTGCLITAIALKEKIELREITKENLDSMLVNLIFVFRKQRARQFVCKEVQFDLLREYAGFLLSRP